MPAPFLLPRCATKCASAAAIALVALAAAPAFTTPAFAHAFKLLHVFCQDPLCPDGFSPSALVSDGAGNFYGTTSGGGPNGGGTIFELKHRANGGYRFKTVYGFCAQTNCFDGQGVGGPPVIDVSGNLYGTALAGGASGYSGDVWELKRKSGTVKVLHSFCVSDCLDGAEPMTNLTYAAAATGALYDGTSPLYGVAPFGGTGSQGTIFQLTPRTRGWKFQVLYNFCADRNCAGGAVPNGPLLPDASGNFYGVTYGGGSMNKGAVYRLSQSGGAWSEAALYSFCQQTDCADGNQPSGSLALDAAGNLFGSTEAGGNSCPKSNVGCGVAFKLTPLGQESVLHAFCAMAKCADGAEPFGPPFIAAGGDLIGTAQFGGNASSDGVVWRLSGGNFETLHKFCGNGDCSAGSNPAAAPISDGAGHLIGTTFYGGPNFGGVIYQITP